MSRTIRSPTRVPDLARIAVEQPCDDEAARAQPVVLRDRRAEIARADDRESLDVV